MNQLINLNKRHVRLQKNLLCAIEQFKNSNDNVAMDILLNVVEELETILNASCYLGEFVPNINQLLKAMQGLYVAMQNNDVIAVTELLELELYPLIKELQEGDMK